MGFVMFIVVLGLGVMVWYLIVGKVLVGKFVLVCYGVGLVVVLVVFMVVLIVMVIVGLIKLMEFVELILV